MRDERLAAQVIGERLAYVLGDREPRRAASAFPPPVESGFTAREEGTADGGESALDPGKPGAVPPAFSRLHVGVICALLFLGLVLGALALLRARPVALAAPQITPVSISASAPSRASPGASASSSSRPRIVVHVLGEVRRPGLVRLPERSRVQDAIDAAGGLRDTAAPGDLNLAQILVDGQQIVIGSRARPGGRVRDSGAARPGPEAGGAATTSQIDLNAATAAQLESLPGVGPVTAERILAWRTEHERFRRVEELQEVDGIGPKTYAEIAPHVRV